MKEEQYSLRQQRDNFIRTIRNDAILKDYPKVKHRLFEQVAAGQKAFKNKWNNPIFRLGINIILPFVMMASNIALTLKFIFLLFRYKKKEFKYDRLFISHDRRLYTLVKRIDISNDDAVWLRLFSDTFNIEESVNKIELIDLLNYKDVLVASFQSFLIHLRVVYEVGYRYYFLSYKSFSWTLTDFALRKVPLDTELIFSCICDRNAILIDKLPHSQKTLIQHGAMHFANNDIESKYLKLQNDKNFYLWESLYKCSPSRVYCFTKMDEWALSKSVISNHPQFIHIGYGFKPAYKPDKISVLIVGNYYLFKEKEEKILFQLKDSDFEVYIKNHPSHSNEIYNELIDKYNVHFINGLETKLPDVDLLISYDSTLACEYASIGTPILYYGHFDIDNVLKAITDKIKITKCHKP